MARACQIQTDLESSVFHLNLVCSFDDSYSNLDYVVAAVVVAAAAVVVADAVVVDDLDNYDWSYRSGETAD